MKTKNRITFLIIILFVFTFYFLTVINYLKNNQIHKEINKNELIIGMQFIKICTFSMGGWFETLKNLIKKKDQKRVHHNKQGIVLLCLTWQVKHIIMIHVSQLKKVMIKLVAFWCKFYMGSVKLSLFTFHIFIGVFFDHSQSCQLILDLNLNVLRLQLKYPIFACV